MTRDRPRQSALLGWRRERPSAPATLSGDEVRRLLAACACRRDRLLVALLYDTGVRIGEALGLRHEDLDPRHTSVRVAVRDNPNGARAKSGPRLVPASAALFTLYKDASTYYPYRGLAGGAARARPGPVLRPGGC